VANHESARPKPRIIHRSSEDENGCWIWSGALTGAGYGQLSLNNRKQYAHRVSYEAFVGPIPDGLHIDHLCRVRRCVNPAHLEPVTVAENNRRASRRPTCSNGHEMTPENTIWEKQGAGVPLSRRCSACRYRRNQERARRDRESRARLREAAVAS
jgi:hypothetical protein